MGFEEWFHRVWCSVFILRAFFLLAWYSRKQGQAEGFKMFQKSFMRA